MAIRSKCSLTGDNCCWFTGHCSSLQGGQCSRDHIWLILKATNRRIDDRGLRKHRLVQKYLPARTPLKQYSDQNYWYHNFESCDSQGLSGRGGH
jgi:hypothetical protein